MPIDRSTLVAGPAKLVWGAGTFFSQSDIVIAIEPTLNPVETSVHGVIDQAVTDMMVKVTARLWGAWENLTILFPASVLQPTIGTDIYGTSDVTLTINGRDGNQLLMANAQMTKVSNLFLGVNEQSFSADVEWTCLIKNNTNPEAANAFWTTSAVAFADATFAKTNYKQQRFTAAWGAQAGFTAFQAQKGWTIDWALDLVPRKVDAVGTVGMKIVGFQGTARCIPLTPSIDNIAAAIALQGVSGLGRLISSVASADLVITGAAAQTITLRKAGMTKSGLVYGSEPERQGETEWMSTTGFTTGVADTRAIIA